MIGISDKQGEMLAFIELFVTKNGYPPTHEEIRTGLKLSTKSLVNYHLEALENAALLTRVPKTPRGLRLTRGSRSKKISPALAIADPPAELTTLDHDQVVELTYDMVTNNSNLYALKVEDDTIINAQANHGDVAIVQRQTHAQNGEVVAVRLFEHGQTKLKRYYRENGHVRLEASHNDRDTLFVKPDDVEIQGKVVAVIRNVD